MAAKSYTQPTNATFSTPQNWHTFKFPTHGTMYYIVVYVNIIEVYMLLAVFMFIFINFLFDCRTVSFPHFELTTKCASGE